AGGLRTVTETTPLGRQRVLTLDSLGRVIREQAGTLAGTDFTYNTQGRVQTITRGVYPDHRTYTLTYDTKQRLATIQDPLLRTVTFGYDDADRVTVQTFPDTRQLLLGYTANGDLAAVTPPGRPVHTFTYTPVDLVDRYTPPDLGMGATQTIYTYNADRQLELITRPDGQAIDLGYDAAGRLETVTIPNGLTTAAYHTPTGNLASITTPAGDGLFYAYDGGLLTSTTWTGAVAGSVSHSYDPDFRLAETRVNGGQAASLGYDADGLLTQAGALTLTRHAQNGFVTGSTLGAVTDTRGYNAFGEPTSYEAKVNGTPQLTVTYDLRDLLGRIAQKTETTAGNTDVFGYGYDAAGRL
ncbi:MAG: RHS repeat protein, partial [Candidatus Rokuibacteriota bacterium]